MIGEALVRVRRGAGVESEHRVAWATTDRGRGGRAHAAGGGTAAYPGPRVYARSAAKPFQALPVVADGAANIKPDGAWRGDTLFVTWESNRGGTRGIRLATACACRF